MNELTSSDNMSSESTLREALAKRSRPSRTNSVNASLTFGWRAMLKIKYVPEQMLDVTLFPIMFTVMFTYLFGGAIAGSTGEYLQFLLPGILVQTVVFTTIYSGLALNTDISKGIFDRFRTLPIWQPSVLVGALLGDTVRYTIASSIVVILGLVLGFRPSGGVLGVVLAVLVLLLFAYSLSWVFTALGLVLRTPNSVMGVSMTVLFPLTFASNIFVDPQTMPSWLQAFVEVNPITLVVTAVRGLMHGTMTSAELGLALFACAIFIIFFAPLTMYLYRKKR